MIYATNDGIGYGFLSIFELFIMLIWLAIKLVFYVVFYSFKGIIYVAGGMYRHLRGVARTP